MKPETGTHASGRWLGTKQKGGCAVGCISSPKGETYREECEPTLPAKGSPKGDMSGSEHPRDSAFPKGKTIERRSRREID